MASSYRKLYSDNSDSLKFFGECGTQLIPYDEVTPSLLKSLETRFQKLRTGTIFANRYKILKLLVKEGMGKVYKAHHLSLF